MPAEGTAAKTAIAPRLLNEHLRSATHLSRATTRHVVQPLQASSTRRGSRLLSRLPLQSGERYGRAPCDIRDAPLIFEVRTRQLALQFDCQQARRVIPVADTPC